MKLSFKRFQEDWYDWSIFSSNLGFEDPSIIESNWSTSNNDY